MSELQRTTPRCAFHVRTTVSDGPPPTYHYEQVHLSGWDHDGRLHTPHPPQVGDLIFLWDDLKKNGGYYRVIERSWLHAAYGSTDWPHAEMSPKKGPLVDIVVEPAEGIFRGEAPGEDDTAVSGE